MKIRLSAVCLFLCPLLVWPQSTPAPVVRFHTNMGDIDVTMIPVAAPNTVTNFLGYVNRGDYDNSVFHRSVQNFIIQGGGYQLKEHKLVEIPQQPAVKNEFSVSNVRGTLAMAQLDGDVNSATNQWFFNTNDNSKTLNSQRFAVFGRIAAGDTASFAVMDAISDVPVVALASPFDQIPLRNYTSGTPGDDSYVVVLSVRVLDSTPPVISPGGIVTAGNFGGFPAAAGGSFIEIYGTNLSGSSREWSTNDFTAGAAPTSLDGVSVTVGGQPAFVDYVSPTQVNVQVPAAVAAGDAVPVVVSYNGRASASVPIAIKPLAGGIFAPPSLNVGGKQFAGAYHNATGAAVTAAAPAVAGEVLIFYGVGFGPVLPGSVPVAGQIVKEFASVATPVEFRLGGVAAEVLGGGLVPGLVGLYQFNVVVPKDVPTGDVALAVTQGGQAITQSLYIPVGK